MFREGLLKSEARDWRLVKDSSLTSLQSLAHSLLSRATPSRERESRASVPFRDDLRKDGERDLFG